MPAPVETKLGPIAQVHRVRKGIRRNRLATSLGLLAAASLLWIVAAARGYFALTLYGPLLVGRWTTPWGLAAATLTMLGGWTAVRAWRASRFRVRLHEGGLALLRGRRGRGLAWGEVRALWSRATRTGLPGLPGRLRMRLDVESSDGHRLRLDDSLEDFAGLAEAIKARVYPSLLDAATRGFNDGRPLTFGPLQLSRGGLSDGRRNEFGWDAILSSELSGGRLILTTSRNGKQVAVRFPADRIPNVELCAQLIQEIGQSR